MTRSQKRSLQACKDVKVVIGKPRYSYEKFELYLNHKQRFHALQDDVEDEGNFRISFYVNTPFGVEFEYYLDDKLVGVALGDLTGNTFSAIYTFYNSPERRMGLGTFSVLQQLKFCENQDVRYFYLGYYISSNKSLMYKAGFRPNEVYVDNDWRPFRNVKGDYLISLDKIHWKNSEFLVKASAPLEPA